ncbi:redoxin family protein [Halovenus sp. WSH3]|uniref:Redoxin family protein n=1 Tax=Halovenus carboxidivorans TaxID=2692199 RepID=A0A6B0SX05_9EURY|nr:TlpA disulfide reductase family protein [Halovenus carboxidivorans]MXR50228.1 redoxin family protein [Halovenus carboxidivorans]
MTRNNTPTGEESASDSVRGDRRANREGPAGGRRRFLGALAGTGSVALAGCLDRALAPLDTADSESVGETTLTALDVGGSDGGTVEVLPRGRITLLDFWATWCTPCKPQMEELGTIREEFPDIHMVSITNESDEEAIRSFWRKYDGTWTVAMDPDAETNETFGVTRIPTLLVLDEAGKEVWRHTGLSSASDIAEAIESTR